MMNCTAEFQKNYSVTMLNHALYDDAGSWWWWTNVIGTLCFGTIGLIGNAICFLVVHRCSLPQHSFVEYLRALAIFDFISLIFECSQSLNDLFVYLFSINVLNIRSSLICKLYEYTNHVIILLACWTIVGLTFDRLILVCDPFSKQWPNFSRRICNIHCAKKIIFILVILSLIINIPYSLYQKWVCKKPGYQYSAAFIGNLYLNETQTNHCIGQCRISSNMNDFTRSFIVKWKVYIFHLCCYTLIPAIILIASNTAILKLVHTPRKIVGQQNEHIRSKLTLTLTLVSIMFLILYFPHAIVVTLSLIMPHTDLRCNIALFIRIRILRRLTELLNVIALSINFFLYILGVHHYRSGAIQMLGLHNFNAFLPYLTVEHRNSIGSIPAYTNQQHRRNTQTDSSSIKLLKVINNGSPSISVYNKRLSS